MIVKIDKPVSCQSVDIMTKDTAKRRVVAQKNILLMIVMADVMIKNHAPLVTESVVKTEKAVFFMPLTHVSSYMKE